MTTYVELIRQLPELEGTTEVDLKTPWSSGYNPAQPTQPLILIHGDHVSETEFEADDDDDDDDIKDYLQISHVSAT